jgi:hypothetical protein
VTPRDPTVPLPVQVAESVAEELERDTTEMPPLSDYVDLEAAEQVLAAAGGDAGPVVVRFEYEGVEVTVTEEGIGVDPADRTGD